MSTIAFKVHAKGSDYVKPSLLPLNHSKQTHFGVIDGVIAVFFLSCAAGLLYALLHL